MYGHIVIIIIVTTTIRDFLIGLYFHLLIKSFILCECERLLRGYDINISLSLVEIMGLALLFVTVVQILSN